MMKRIITLIVTSSLISAGLLYLGFTLLSQYTPAHASTLKALVAETGLQGSVVSASADDSSLSSRESHSENSDSSSSSSPSQSSSSPVISSVPQVSSGSASAGAAPISGITIAELLKNLGLNDEILVTLTGIATSLDSERFLLNDGTGQIIVEVEDDQLVQLPDINGLSVTVTGKFEASSSSSSGPELKAFSLTALGQTFVFSDDVNDDDLDDDDAMGDDLDDDSGDDLDDDSSGSDSDDDLSDDHSGSGSDDDLSDDHSGSGSDDGLGDDNSGSSSSDSSWGEIDD